MEDNTKRSARIRLYGVRLENAWWELKALSGEMFIIIGLYFFVMSDAYVMRLRCIFVFSFTKKSYLHRLNDGDGT